MMETRKYYQSSSFKMAVLFTVILGLSAVILGYFMFSYTQGERISATQVAISNDTYNRILWLGVICIILLSVVSLISFGLSIFVVKRINIISATARKIMVTGDLSRRIDIDHRWDDLSNLAYILNDMFARIEQLMTDIRLVSDNIAHDLRTPLTRLRNNLESLNSENNNPQNTAKLISEADNLLQTFNAILRITNIEKGKRHSNFAEVSLNSILNDVVELYEPVAAEKKINIKSNLQEINYFGDKDLLFQAFANILDNSIKYTHENGSIEVELKSEDNRKIILIKDSGIGVSEQDKPKIFDRFYRADESRNSKGNGLGLSLVRAIITLHKGKIELLDNQPNGLVVRIVL